MNGYYSVMEHVDSFNGNIITYNLTILEQEKAVRKIEKKMEKIVF